MRVLCGALTAYVLMAGITVAEPFQEVTVGVPVSSIADAETWYLNLFGANTEVIKPVPGVVEFKVASGVWFQIFETENQPPSATVVRFLVDDIDVAQAEWSAAGIDTGEAIQIPNVVTFSEFFDPDGNALGLYDLP